MKRARFVAAARREFLSEVLYYNGVESGLGARFAAAVEEATARAVAFPLSGSLASKSTRRVFVQDFPFAVVYRASPDGIIVFAVAHHSRRPEYWRSRPLTKACRRRPQARLKLVVMRLTQTAK